MNMGAPWFFFCAAVHRDHLPHRVAMDYSFPDTWNRAPQYSAGPPALSDTEVFLKVVEEGGRGSFGGLLRSDSA
jgi:hypothetical protein